MHTILSRGIATFLLVLLLFFQCVPVGWGVKAHVPTIGDVDFTVDPKDQDVADILRSASENGSFDISNMMDQIEERYHLNTESLQSYGDSMNVSESKKAAPEVSLFFSPASPVPGEDVTATATSLYFNSDREHLYFTWLLKHEACGKGTPKNDDVKNFCDLDKNGSIDENDWKIAATRTIANGGFDWEGGNYDKDEDKDGFDTQNIFGGDQGYTEDAAYCSAQDSESGILYELKGNGCRHYFPHTGGRGTVGDGSFGKDEERFFHTDPYDPDTAGTGQSDEANVVGLGRDSLTWKYAVGDKVSVIVEGVSSIPTKHDNASFATMWAIPKNTCGIDGKGEYIEKVKGYDVTFLTGEQNLNDCVEKTLADPREGGQTERMKAGLAYTPTFVSNDTSGDGFGDTVEITSSVENTEADAKTLKYEWTVYINKDGSYDPRGFSMSDDLDTTGGGKNKWVDVTKFLRANDFIGSYIGNGIASLPITMNLTSALLKEYSGKRNPSDAKDPQTETINKLRVYQKDPSVGEEKNRSAGVSSVFGESDSRDRIGTAYLKVAVKIAENLDMTGRNAVQGNKRTATANVIVPVSRMGDNQIMAKKVSVNENNVLVVQKVPKYPDTPNGPKIDAIICDERPPKSNETTNYNYLGIGRNLCLVLKNEILNLSVNNDDGALTNFQWTSNGESLPCTSSMAETSSSPAKPLCDDAQEGNTTFLPITEEAGKTYDVNVTALDSTTGKRISVSRAFQVIDSYASIVSKDKNVVWQKYLGYYKKTDPKDGKLYAYEDLSATRFQGFPKTAASFRVNFPSGIEDRCRWQWTVDGVALSDKKNAKEIQMNLSESPGTIHRITVEGYYLENEKIRNALSEFWDVSVFDTAEKSFSQTVEVEVVENTGENALASPKSFFAAIAKNAPAQILFVFELFLSVFVMIVLLSLVFTIFATQPERE